MVKKAVKTKVSKSIPKYLCVDTNIFIQCCLLEIDGDNLDVLTQLHSLLDKDQVILLLPEVIKLEFYRVLEYKIELLKDQIGVHKFNISKDTFNKKIKDDLIAKLEECAQERRDNANDVKKEIEEIFQHRNTIQGGLELTPNLFVEAYKSFLSNSKPYKKSADKNVVPIQQDCLIIESLKKYFNTVHGKYKFYFCSRNKTDFADIEAVNIHQDIKRNFLSIVYYENLGVLLNKEFKAKISREVIAKLEDESESKLPEKLDEAKLSSGGTLPLPGLGAGDNMVDLESGEPIKS